jgi:hypothetical protein
MAWIDQLWKRIQKRPKAAIVSKQRQKKVCSQEHKQSVFSFFVDDNQRQDSVWLVALGSWSGTNKWFTATLMQGKRKRAWESERSQEELHAAARESANPYSNPCCAMAASTWSWTTIGTSLLH